MKPGSALHKTAVASALVAQLRALQPGAKPHLGQIRRAIAEETGACSGDDLRAAIDRLRMQGKMHWQRLELSPSMLINQEVRGGQPEAGASGPPAAGPFDDDGPEDEYPGEVNDRSAPARRAQHPPAPQGSGQGVAAPASVSAPEPPLPSITAQARGVHGAATKAGARPVPAPAHEPEIQRLVREEATARCDRRRLARSSGTVRQPLGVGLLVGEEPVSLSEAVASLLAEEPHDLIVAINRRHNSAWRRIVMLARATDRRPGQALYDVLERGLAELEAPQKKETPCRI